MYHFRNCVPMHELPLDRLAREQQGSGEFLLRPDKLNSLSLNDETLAEFTTVEHAPQLLELPLMGVTVQAGFPSPAEDYVECRLDVNEFLISHPSATFLCGWWGIR